MEPVRNHSKENSQCKGRDPECKIMGIQEKLAERVQVVLEPFVVVDPSCHFESGRE